MRYLIASAFSLLAFAPLAKAQTSPMPDMRYWWSADANNNGEYNYSWTEMQGGSSIQVSNQWGDAAVSFILTGPYGTSPIPTVTLHFQHNGSGYAAANLTTSVENTGSEPTSFEDRDAGKAIDSQNTVLNFGARGYYNGLRVKLIDRWGQSSASVNIHDYRSEYGRYLFAYNIPTSAFAAPDFDFSAVKSVTFFVDSSTPAGIYNLDAAGIRFQRIAE